jgi:F-type H+-transporting ATPase subunit b
MAESHSTGTEAPASGHSGGFPPFQKETFPSQLLWLAVFFIALYVVASRLALPRVGSIIADRRARIAADLAEAARMKSDADAAIASYEKDLADARARAQGMAAETRNRLNAEAEQHRKAVEADLHGRMTDAEKTITAAKSAAMANVRGIAEDVAIAIVTRLSGTPPSKAAAAAAVKAVSNN